MSKLTGQTAIITGGARGMGETTARLFAAEGARVIIADILEQEGEALAADIGGEARFIKLDVRSEESWQRCVEVADARGDYSILVNNAGILTFASIAEQSAEDYMKVIEVNQLGVYLGIRASIPAMKARGRGSIINISSIDGLQSKNGISAYSSSKWAIRGLTKSAAIELGPYNIRVNSVHPGGIFTAMHGAGNAEPGEADNAFYKDIAMPRVGLPIEVAKMSLFLASEDSSYSTGAEFKVDGGWNAGCRLDFLPSS